MTFRPKNSEEAVIQCLRFFDFFQYPLTLMEIWRYQEGDFSFEQIQQGVSLLIKKEEICEWNGFVSLCGESCVKEQVIVRQQRYLDAMKKRQKLKWVLPVITRMPGVKGVALSNFFPLHFTEERSDIDLFVITEKEHIWRTRFYLSTLFKFLRQRPGEVKKHAIDLSFFISEEQMNLSFLQKEPDDPYLRFWIRALLPVFEAEKGLFERFFQENNWLSFRLIPREPVDQKKWKWPLYFSEKWAKKIQEKWFSRDVLENMNNGTDIIVSDQMLKFHKNDRREAVCRHVYGK